MNIIIVRHAEPDYSIDSLTHKGVREARALAEVLKKVKADGYYCSPLGRAQRTAFYTLKAVKKEAVTLPWLEEFRGKYVKEDGSLVYCWDLLPSQWTNIPELYTDQWLNADIYREGTVQSEYKTVCDGVDELLKEYGYVHDGKIFRVEKENHGTIILFCHFAVECVILSHLFGISPVPLWHNFVALPSSVTVISSEEREKGIASFRLSRFGDISHLNMAGKKPSFMARFCECYSDKTRH